MKMSIIRKPLWSPAAIHKVMPVGILCILCAHHSQACTEKKYFGRSTSWVHRKSV